MQRNINVLHSEHMRVDRTKQTAPDTAYSIVHPSLKSQTTFRIFDQTTMSNNTRNKNKGMRTTWFVAYDFFPTALEAKEWCYACIGYAEAKIMNGDGYKAVTSEQKRQWVEEMAQSSDATVEVTASKRMVG